MRRGGANGGGVQVGVGASSLETAAGANPPVLGARRRHAGPLKPAAPSSLSTREGTQLRASRCTLHKGSGVEVVSQTLDSERFCCRCSTTGHLCGLEVLAPGARPDRRQQEIAELDVRGVLPGRPGRSALLAVRRRLLCEATTRLGMMCTYSASNETVLHWVDAVTSNTTYLVQMG